jgi:hypothetical protein
MASDPGKGMRDYGLAAERAAKDIDKIAERMRASLEKAHDKLGKDFNAEMRFMVAAFGKGTKEMDVSMGTLPKSLERVFGQMGAITTRGTKKFLDLKKALEGVGTFMPKALGVNAFSVLQSTMQNAAKMDAEFVVKHAAIGKRSEEIVKAFTGEGNAAKRTFDIIQAGRQYALAGSMETYKQEVAQANRNPALILAARTKLAKSVVDLDKRTQREVSRASLSEAGKFGADAAARRVSSGARGIMAGTGDLSLPGLLQRSKAVQGLAAAEKDVAERRKSGDTSASLTTGQKGMSEILGVVQKLAAGITPMTVMAQVVMQLISAFDRAKMSGAAMAEVVGAQGPLKGAGGAMGLVKSSALALKMETNALIQEMGPLRTVNVDELQISSAKAARTMGGIARDAIPGVISGLSAVQVMAPLAGMDAASALGMVAKGQKAFGLKSQSEIRSYFQSIMGGARAAGMGVEDFASSIGDIDKMGLKFGTSIESLVGKDGAMTRLMAGLGAKGSSGLRGMVGGAFAQLSTLSLGQTLAMRMAGGRQSFGGAVKDITTEKSPILGNVRAFREMIAMQHPGALKGDPEALGKVMLRMENQFGTNFAMRMGRDQNTFKQFLTGSNEGTKEFREAMAKAELDKNPLQKAAEIASSQLDTLTQIQKTIEEFMQGVLGSALFGVGSNPARDAALGRSNNLVKSLTAATAESK